MTNSPWQMSLLLSEVSSCVEQADCLLESCHAKENRVQSQFGGTFSPTVIVSLPDLWHACTACTICNVQLIWTGIFKHSKASPPSSPPPTRECNPAIWATLHSCVGERQELSELLDTASHRVSHLEAAHIQHGSKEASLKDKVSTLLLAKS